MEDFSRWLTFVHRNASWRRFSRATRSPADFFFLPRIMDHHGGRDKSGFTNAVLNTHDPAWSHAVRARLVYVFGKRHTSVVTAMTSSEKHQRPCVARQKHQHTPCCSSSSFRSSYDWGQSSGDEWTGTNRECVGSNLDSFPGCQKLHNGLAGKLFIGIFVLAYAIPSEHSAHVWTTDNDLTVCGQSFSLTPSRVNQDFRFRLSFVFTNFFPLTFRTAKLSKWGYWNLEACTVHSLEATWYVRTVRHGDNSKSCADHRSRFLFRYKRVEQNISSALNWRTLSGQQDRFIIFNRKAAFSVIIYKFRNCEFFLTFLILFYWPFIIEKFATFCGQHCSKRSWGIYYRREDDSFPCVRELRDDFEPRLAFQQWNIHGSILE